MPRSIDKIVRELVEEKYPAFSPAIRSVLESRYVTCIMDRCIDDGVVNEIFEADFDIMAPIPDKTDIYDFVEDSEAALDDPEQAVIEGVRQYLLAALAYQDQLQAASQEDLTALFEAFLQGKLNEALVASVALDKDSFFSQPDANADFDYWSGIDVIECAEAAALSLGKDPRILTESAIVPHVMRRSPFAQEFVDRLRKTRRALEASTLRSLRRPDFAAWALDAWPSADERFLAWCRSNAVLAVPAPKTGTATKDGKLPTSAYKMLVGMAMKHYGFSRTHVKGVRTGCFQGIVDTLVESRLSIDRQTVRDHLLDGLQALEEKGAFERPRPA